MECIQKFNSNIPRVPEYIHTTSYFRCITQNYHTSTIGKGICHF